MSLPGFDKCTKSRKKEVGWLNVLSVICRWPCCFRTLPSPCPALRVAHVYTRGYTIHTYAFVYCPHNVSHGSNIITISCARLRLQLYYCSPYRNSPRGFRSPRACYDLFLSFPKRCPSSTPDVTENRGLAVVINDSLRSHTVQCCQRTSLEFVQRDKISLVSNIFTMKINRQKAIACIVISKCKTIHEVSLSGITERYRVI